MFLTQTLALLPLFTLALARLPSLNPLQPHSLSLSPDAAAAQLLALRLLPPHLSSRILLPRVHALHLRSEGEGFLAPPPPPAPPATEKASPAAASPAASPATATAAAADGAAGASALAGWRELPMPSSAAVAQDGVYLLDSLEQLVLWVGAQAHPTFLEGLFGTATPADGAAPLPAAATPQVRAAHGARSVWHTCPGVGAVARASLQAWVRLIQPSLTVAGTRAARCARRAARRQTATRAAQGGRAGQPAPASALLRPAACRGVRGLRAAPAQPAGRALPPPPLGTRPPAAWRGTGRAATRRRSFQDGYAVAVHLPILECGR